MSIRALSSGCDRRVTLNQIYQGAQDGFQFNLFDHLGRSIDVSVGRVKGTRSGLTIHYDVGAARRAKLNKIADEAKFRTVVGSKNRAKDI
ncbi:MAG: hypothetical protein MPJ50_14545 [Pirellulales bacterium]|nr:hypothetical protein [Pirellulales bacterium]